MGISLGVAGKADLRGAFESQVLVTAFTCDGNVFAGEGKDRLGMVKGGWFPSF